MFRGPRPNVIKVGIREVSGRCLAQTGEGCCKGFCRPSEGNTRGAGLFAEFLSRGIYDYGDMAKRWDGIAKKVM